MTTKQEERKRAMEQENRKYALYKIFGLMGIWAGGTLLLKAIKHDTIEKHLKWLANESKEYGAICKDFEEGHRLVVRYE